MKRMLLFVLAAMSAAVLTMGDKPGKPAGRKPFDPKTMPAKRSSQGPQISYHGGPIMNGVNNHVYVIYYGQFPASTTKIIDAFLENVGGSPAFNVNTTYYDKNGQHIQNVLTYNPSTDSFYDANSLGSKLGSNFAVELLQSALSNNSLPTDQDGIYLEIISPAVSVSNSNYCGYHTDSLTVAQGVDIKYAVVPDPGVKHYN